MGEIEIFRQYEKGLERIEKFSHIEIYYFFHRSKSHSLLIKSRGGKKKRGVFATRSPNRPNCVGNSVVKLLERRGNVLKVEGIDVIDGTPLLDIKPYNPELYPKT